MCVLLGIWCIASCSRGCTAAAALSHSACWTFFTLIVRVRHTITEQSLNSLITQNLRVYGRMKTRILNKTEVFSIEHRLSMICPDYNVYFNVRSQNKQHRTQERSHWLLWTIWLHSTCSKAQLNTSSTVLKDNAHNEIVSQNVVWWCCILQTSTI